MAFKRMSAPLNLDANSGERAGETVRDAISRRTFEGVEALVRDVNGDSVTFDMGYRCLLILQDIVLPFLTYDSKQRLTEVVSKWREMADKQEKERTTRQVQQEMFRRGLEPMRSLDEVAF